MHASDSHTALFLLLIVAVCILVPTTQPRAEPASFNPDDAPATLIAWAAEADLGDHVGRATGVVGSAGQRFYLSGLNVMSPLVIKVFAEEEAKPVDVSLHRFLWRKAELSGQTDAEGSWGFAGRIHNEVGIEIRAAEPTEFYVLAWMGDPAETDFGANAFVAADTGRAATAQEPTVSWLMIGAIVILLVFCAFLLGKLRSGKSAAMILIVMLVGLQPQKAEAEAIESRLAAAEAKIIELRDLIREGAERDRVEDARLDANIKELQEREDRTTENGNRIRRLENLYRELGDNISTTNSIIAEELHYIRADIDALFMLVSEDRAAVPDPSHGGVSPMPSGCVDNPACRACSNEVNARLSGRLANYEIMRVIYQTTVAYNAKMIDVGNSMSGWHQLEQASWFQAKLKIVQAEQELTVAYKDKLEQFNADLMNILQGFGRCEEQYGMEDWFNRYGLLYYNNLIASYRIP